MSKHSAFTYRCLPLYFTEKGEQGDVADLHVELEPAAQLFHSSGKPVPETRGHFQKATAIITCYVYCIHNWGIWVMLF